MNAPEIVEAECREIYAEAHRVFADISRRRDYYGFKIFNSPPTYRTPFLFIGYQPGGGADDFQQEEALGSHLMWPAETEYAHATWPLAIHMRNMFQPTVDLRKCVGLNAIFLRCPNIAQYYRNLDGNTRSEVWTFCKKQVHRIMDVIEPRNVVAIGFSTLRLFGETEPCARSPSGRILTREGKIGTRNAIAMLHLSGARISNEDRKLIAKSVLSWAVLEPGDLIGLP